MSLLLLSAGGCGSGVGGGLSLHHGWWLDSWPLQSACQSVLGQDAEPKIATDSSSIDVPVCVSVFDEEAGTL